MPHAFLVQQDLANFLDNISDSSIQKWNQLRTIIDYERDEERAFCLLTQALSTIVSCPAAQLFTDDVAAKAVEYKKDLILIIYQQLKQLVRSARLFDTWQQTTKQAVVSLNSIEDKLIQRDWLEQKGKKFKILMGMTMGLAILLPLISFEVINETRSTSITSTNSTLISSMDVQEPITYWGLGSGSVILTFLFLYWHYMISNPLTNLENEIRSNLLELTKIARPDINREAKRSSEEMQRRQDAEAIKKAIEPEDRVQIEGKEFDEDEKAEEGADNSMPCCSLCATRNKKDDKDQVIDSLLLYIKIDNDGKPNHYHGPFHNFCIGESIKSNRGTLEPSSGRVIPIEITIQEGQFVITFPTHSTYVELKATNDLNRAAAEEKLTPEPFVLGALHNAMLLTLQPSQSNRDYAEFRERKESKRSSTPAVSEEKNSVVIQMSNTA